MDTCPDSLMSFHRVHVYNRLWFIYIVGVACFLRHQLAAVLDVSFSVFRMTFAISQTKRMGGDDDFGDIPPMYM